MKTVKFFIGALALAVVSMVTAPAVNAQQENKDENGKTIRHPYLTNGLWDNWFVGVGAGVNSYLDHGFNKLGFALDVNAGKWVTPCVGVRFGYNGLNIHGREVTKYNMNYAHIDLLWNISNAIGGYKESRFWDFVPYTHSGGVWFNKDRELVFGAGLLNLVRLSKRLDLTLDVRGGMVNGSIDGTRDIKGILTATAGLSVNLGKTTWTRASEYHNPADEDKIAAAEAAAAALTAANAALAADKAKLEKENDALEDENAKLAKAAKDAAENAGLKEVGPASFYFEIGKTELSAKELKHLDFYMQNVLPNVKNSKATVITGTADSNTGYAKRNEYLSKKRAEYLVDLLKNKYGVDTEDIVVKNQVVKATGSANAAFERAVVVSFE
ncbi:MAG: OmpA family protein [Bacteroidales bacterium]|nr:OmpA family protein [Bacteroidales bacterium]